MNTYVQINENNIVVGIVESPAQPDSVNSPNLIYIPPGLDVNLGDEYNSISGKFTHKLLHQPLPEISNEQLAQQLSDLKVDLILAGVISDE